MKNILIYSSIVLWVTLFSSCSSLQKTSKQGTETVHEVLLDDLRYRSETGYTPIASLIAEWMVDENFEAILKCLNSIQKGSVTYAYTFEGGKAQLRWLKSKPEALCTQNLLPVIPFPLEMYWMGRNHERKSLECYALNFNPEVNIFADIHLPWNRYRLEIPFPLQKPLKTKKELYYWYEILLLQSIKTQFGGTLQGSLMPELMCQECFGDDPYYSLKMKEKIPTPTWKSN